MESQINLIRSSKKRMNNDYNNFNSRIKLQRFLNPFYIPGMLLHYPVYLILHQLLALIPSRCICLY